MHHKVHLLWSVSADVMDKIFNFVLQIYLMLSCCPCEGRISGIVDTPNACCTLAIPTAIFDQVRPSGWCAMSGTWTIQLTVCYADLALCLCMSLGPLNTTVLCRTSAHAWMAPLSVPN